MSGSLASAKAKRAGIAPTTPPPTPPQQQQQQQQQPPGVRLSIPQVITMLDSRLAKLEIGARSTPAPAPAPAAAPAFDRSVLEDLDAKFMMLAEEITMMKDVIMKLQAFTMDVNKTLFDERIHIMSDMNDEIKPRSVVDDSLENIQIETLDNSVENII